MIKKIVLGVALAGLVGVLVFGAVGRTDARLDTGTEEGRGAQGYGQPGDDGLNQDQQGGPRYGRADGRAQEGPYDPGSGLVYGQEGAGLPVDCDGDCDCDGPDHDQQGGRRSDTARAGLGQGQGGSQGGGAGGGTAEGGKIGDTGQAQVGEWVTLEGVVTSLDADAMVVVSAANGEIVEVGNRAWWFAQEQGFAANVGDDVILLGFYEGDKLEVGGIIDSSSGQTVSLRDESGRPLWAGRGNRG